MRAKLLLGTALALFPLVGAPLVSASGETIEESMIKAYMTNPTLAAEPRPTAGDGRKSAPGPGLAPTNGHRTGRRGCGL